MYEIFEQLLQKYGVTSYKVAKEAGVTQTALSNWKAGRSTPTTKTLQKIADYFGVTIDYLMTGKEDEKEKSPELTARDKRDIAKDLENIMAKIRSGEDGPLRYNGEAIDEESLKLLESAIGTSLQHLKIVNKEKIRAQKQKVGDILKLYKKKTPAYYAAYLKRKFQTNNPVEIAECLGIELFYAPLGKISGYYKYLKRHKCIYINSDIDNERLARLVVAHELGHAVMHPKENCYFFENKTFLLTSRYEIEANKFAADLLIDDSILEEHKHLTTGQLSRLLGYDEKLIELRLK